MSKDRAKLTMDDAGAQVSGQRDRGVGGQRSRDDPQRGSAPVDFVLVGSVLTVLFLAIVQLALVLHVHNTLVDAASAGAHYGVLADRTPADSVSRAQSLINSSLSPDYSRNVSFHEETTGGVPTLVVTVKAPLPVIGLIGFTGGIEVDGHAALQN